MATPLVDQARELGVQGVDPTATQRPAGSLDRLLERTARLSAVLLRAPSARAYVRRNGVLELCGAFPAGTGGADDAQARGLAGEVIHRGALSISPRSARRGAASPPPATQWEAELGIPLRAASGVVIGALVVSDRAGREWTDAEVEHVMDLAAIGMAGLPLRVKALSRSPAERSPGTPFPAPGHTSHTDAEARAHLGDPAAGARERGSRGRLPNGQPPSDSVVSVGEIEPSEAALVELIRRSIVGSLHLGALRTGDRLPSIRQTARAYSVTPYMVLQAYAELEFEGLVERRERSGVFVAEFEAATESDLPETGAWLTEVLTQACQHQVKIPHLPDLIRRWTAAVPVRCACIESCLDSRFALSHELTQQFGIEPMSLSTNVAASDLGNADLLITTAYHASEVGPLAAELHKPLLMATVSPLILSSALNHLRERDLTVICVDRVYGERLRALQGGAYRDRVRVVTTDDEAALASLDRAEAVLLTPAARQRLEQPDFRLVAPMFPSYSLDFARKVAEALVRINLQGARA